MTPEDGDRIERLDEPTFIVTCASGREGDARRELVRILGPIETRPLFMKGNRLVIVPGGSARDALRKIRDAETETIARVLPVSVKATIGGGVEHMATLGEAAVRVCDLVEGDTFRVRCKRRGHHDFSSHAVERAVGIAVEAATPGEFIIDDHDHIVFVEIYQDWAFVACERVSDLVVKTITLQRVHAPGQRPLNRAESKLREALKYFRVDVGPHLRALDLGAAPGGWTKVLAELGAEVLAVDPGDLDPRVAAMPNVTHFAGLSQQLDQLPDIGPFGLITDDMNRDPDASAAMVLPLLRLLEPDGAVIMTVKFMSGRRHHHVADVLEILAPHFARHREQRMPHNAKETTLHLSGPVHSE